MPIRTSKKRKATAPQPRTALTNRVNKRGRVTKAFADQLAEFIDRYRPALESLAKQ